MEKLTIVARVAAKPGQAEKLIAAQKELVEVVHKLPGCLVYELHEDLEAPGHVLFFERWLNVTSWERHMSGPHMDAFRAQAGHLIGDFELLRMKQIA
jgi:quinol monooxygenase YgiN